MHIEERWTNEKKKKRRKEKRKEKKRQKFNGADEKLEHKNTHTHAHAPDTTGFSTPGRLLRGRAPSCQNERDKKEGKGRRQR